jgi:hypothetical protein
MATLEWVSQKIKTPIAKDNVFKGQTEKSYTLNHTSVRNRVVSSAVSYIPIMHIEPKWWLPVLYKN